MTTKRKKIFLLLSVFCSDLATAFVETSSFSLSCKTTEPIPSMLFAEKGNCEEHEESREWKKVRVARMKQTDEKFSIGEALRNLRLDLESLRQNLKWAEALKDETRIESLSKAIKAGESRDPDYMYQKALGIIEQTRKMKDASQEEMDSLIEKWEKIATAARQYVQEFNLEGLWIGSYGDHGTQLVNVTYIGDTLLAKKVTGDRNVPRGEITFTVNLQKSSVLPPFQFSTKEQSNGDYQRFPGRGQVSRKGFKDHRFVEGQMVLFDDKFSFVWVPTKHDVLFSRPSPEITLKLLRDTISKEDEIENMREHIAGCFEMDMTTCLARQQDPTNFEPLRRIALQKDLDKAEEKMKKQPKKRNFLWQLNQWRKYIDQTLDKH